MARKVGGGDMRQPVQRHGHMERLCTLQILLDHVCREDEHLGVRAEALGCGEVADVFVMVV